MAIISFYHGETDDLGTVCVSYTFSAQGKCPCWSEHGQGILTVGYIYAASVCPNVQTQATC